MLFQFSCGRKARGVNTPQLTNCFQVPFRICSFTHVLLLPVIRVRRGILTPFGMTDFLLQGAKGNPQTLKKGLVLSLLWHSNLGIWIAGLSFADSAALSTFAALLSICFTLLSCRGRCRLFLPVPWFSLPLPCRYHPLVTLSWVHTELPFLLFKVYAGYERTG